MFKKSKTRIKTCQWQQNPRSLLCSFSDDNEELAKESVEPSSFSSDDHIELAKESAEPSSFSSDDHIELAKESEAPSSYSSDVQEEQIKNKNLSVATESAAPSCSSSDEHELQSKHSNIVAAAMKNSATASNNFLDVNVGCGAIIETKKEDNYRLSNDIFGSDSDEDSLESPLKQKGHILSCKSIKTTGFKVRPEIINSDSAESDSEHEQEVPIRSKLIVSKSYIRKDESSIVPKGTYKYKVLTGTSLEAVTDGIQSALLESFKQIIVQSLKSSGLQWKLYFAFVSSINPSELSFYSVNHLHTCSIKIF
jgi:hypothetical protein